MSSTAKGAKRIDFERCTNNIISTICTGTYISQTEDSGPDNNMRRIKFEKSLPLSNLDKVLAVVEYYLMNERKLRKSTVSTYLGYLRTMWNTFDIHEPTVDNAMLLNQMLTQKGLKPNTINHYLEALMYWSTAIGKPIKVKKCRVPRTKPDVLTPDEVVILLQACDTVKNRCIVATMAYLGIRPTECAELRIGDLRLKEGFADIIDHGKGLKTGERTVSLVNEYMQFLHQWLEERSRLGLEYDHRPLQSDDYLFITQFNQPYDADALYQLLRRIAAKTSLAGKVYPYKLRRTYGTVAAYSGVAANILQDEMGHTDVRTTLTYYTGVYKSANRKVMNEKFSYFK